MRWVQVDELIAGEVGYLAASIKAVADARVGDTITLKKDQAAEALAGVCCLHLLYVHTLSLGLLHPCLLLTLEGRGQHTIPWV